MGILNKTPKVSGFMNEIRCDEPSYLIWKWRPAGTRLGESKRENAIRWGSSLRVKDGEVAVFVYNQKNGTMQDFIVGPFDQTIKTANLPVLASIVGLAYDGGTPFQAEIYFINLAQIIQARFAVPYFNVFDPRFKDYGVPVSVRGTISFKISDYREFIKLHRLINFDLNDFQRQISATVSRYVKDTVANAPAEHNIPVIQIESKIWQINDDIEYDLHERLKENFGIDVSGVDISAIEIDKTSDEYSKLMAVTQNVNTAKIQAQTEADIKNIHDKQRVEMHNYEETLRVQREESQYAMHKQTQSANFAAFQVEQQAKVGIAGAEALGHMGENGAGGVDLGGGGSGFNPATMMAGMALGGAVGQNVAGMMNNMMSGINAAAHNGVTPPPIPVVTYYVAVNGQQTGPFDLSTLTKMAAEGQFNGSSLVWKAGMPEWSKAEAIDELKSVLANVMPPIPES